MLATGNCLGVWKTVLVLILLAVISLLVVLQISSNTREIPYQKPSSRISVTEQRLESSILSDQSRSGSACRISVKDHPGSTSWTNGRHGRDEGFFRVSFDFFSGFIRVSLGFHQGFFRDGRDGRGVVRKVTIYTVRSNPCRFRSSRADPTHLGSDQTTII